MRNIYFTCACGKNLAVEERGMGRQVNCPDCQQRIEVPHPTLIWNCPRCGAIMLAPKEAANTEFQCVECKAISMPPTDRCPVCGAELTADSPCAKCGWSGVDVLASATARRVAAASLERAPDDDTSTSRIAASHSPPTLTPAPWLALFRLAAIVLLAGAAVIGYRFYTETQAVKRDTAALSQAIQTAQKSSNIAGAMRLLMEAVIRQPKAQNKAEAELAINGFKTQLNQSRQLEEAIATAAKLPQLDATIRLIETALAHNPIAANREDATHLLAHYRSMKDEDRHPPPDDNTARLPVFTQPDTFFKGHALDFLIFMCRRHRLTLALDEQAVEDLCKMPITLSEPIQISSGEELARFFQSQGLTHKQAQLSPQVRLTFVSYPALLAYYAAIPHLITANPGKALDMLSATPLAGSRLATHAVSLKTILQDLGDSENRIAGCSRDLHKAIDEYNRIRGSYETAERGNPSTANAKLSDSARSMRDAQFRAASSQIDQLRSLRKQIQLAVTDKNRILARQYDEALNLNLVSEALFLNEQLLYTLNRLQTLDNTLRDLNPLTPTFPPVLDSRPRAADTALAEDLPLVRQSLKKQQDTATQRVKTVIERLSETDPSQAEHEFAAALGYDDANPVAKIGLGYCALQSMITALDDLFGSMERPKSRPDSLPAKRQEFDARRGDKQALLQTLLAETGSAPLIAPADVTGYMGTVNTLALSDKGGMAYPIIGKIRKWDPSQPKPLNIRLRASVSDDVDDSSTRLRQLATDYTNQPIMFSEDTPKDSAYLLAAIQSIQWLKQTYPAFGKTNQLGISDTGSASVLAGADSAGSAMAVAGVSILNAIPIRQDVALTGALRPDGTIQATRDIREKITGALQADGIEMAIVPQANEAQLQWLPPDVLCRLIIVTADTIDTYIKYALAYPLENALKLQDVKSMNAWILKLARANDSVSLYIRDNLSPGVRQWIEWETARAVGTANATHRPEGLVSAKTPVEWQDTLIQEMNDLLSKDSFYTPDRFSSFRLSVKTRALLAKKQPGRATLILRNRALLEDAWPELVGPTLLSENARQSMLEQLRLAQVKILLGHPLDAIPLLDPIIAAYPEQFSAHRLRTLIDLYARQPINKNSRERP